jgi:NAD(P)-dependent dehydrogenase (short-subunit alcohol dehydrogenase family)
LSDFEKLAGKTALVTGAAKRLGRAVTLALARAGVNVVLHYQHSEKEASNVAEEVRQTGVHAWTLAADLGRPDEADGLFGRALQQAGPIDILVNNASVFGETTLGEMDAQALHDNVNVNALAPFLLARRFAALGRPGAIVNSLDTMIMDYDRKHVPYHLSKRMLYTLTRMMAVEFAPAIRVNAVAPGLVLPPEGHGLDYLEGLAHSNPLQRYGSEEGVCEAVLFLLRSGFVTGQVIFVDGGRHLRGSLYG